MPAKGCCKIPCADGTGYKIKHDMLKPLNFTSHRDRSRCRGYMSVAFAAKRIRKVGLRHNVWAVCETPRAINKKSHKILVHPARSNPLD